LEASLLYRAHQKVIDLERTGLYQVKTADAIYERLVDETRDEEGFEK
jgi:hypothetical protein